MPRKLYANEGEEFSLDNDSNKDAILQLYSLLQPLSAITRDGQYGTVPMTAEMRLAFAELKADVLNPTKPLRVFDIPAVPGCPGSGAGERGARGGRGAERSRKEVEETKATLDDDGPGGVASNHCQDMGGAHQSSCAEALRASVGPGREGPFSLPRRCRASYPAFQHREVH